MQDLTLPTARTDRDQLASRTDVLDKVGVLRTLPDEISVTTDMVAEFYGIPVKTVQTVVMRNVEEITDDGYRVVTKAVFEETFNMKVSSKANRAALFPRRAVLRIGMLLRDSDVARRVRDMLLDVERADTKLTDDEIVYRALQIQNKKIESLSVENRVLATRIKKDAPLVAKAEAHSTSDSMIHRQNFAREVQQWGVKQGLNILQDHVYELLRRKGMLVAGERSDRNHATAHAVKSGWAWTKKDTTETGHATATTYLNPRGQDVAWKWITSHVNEFGDLRPRDGVA